MSDVDASLGLLWDVFGGVRSAKLVMDDGLVRGGNVLIIGQG